MVSGLGIRPGWHLQMALPVLVTEHSAPGPQGLGSQGSGFSTHLCPWHTYPCWQSGSMTHSGPQPVMVSGLGISPGSQVQMALPCWLTLHRAPGPQGLGWQGSGLATHLRFLQTIPILQSGSISHSGLQPVMVSGLGEKPGTHRHSGLPSLLTVHKVPGPQGVGLQGSTDLGGPTLR